jgi:predicted nucleotidyltransferase
MNLTDEQLNAIREWAVRDQRLQEIRLFGSRVKGTARLDSDVDLAVVIRGDTRRSQWITYVTQVDEWEASLTHLLQLPVRIKQYDAVLDAVVFRYCQEASLAIYRASRPNNGHVQRSGELRF